MKRLKNGFTLAEVLITLAIIGVVAAIVMPSVMANYQYKSIGVKLGKFASTLEGAARPYVVNNGNFKTGSDVEDFVNESFMFKGFLDKTADSNDILSYPEVKDGKYAYDETTRTALAASATNPRAMLKDGTAVQVFLDSTKYSDTAYEIGEDDSKTTKSYKHSEIVAVEKYGYPVFRVAFDPNVQGLPKTSQTVFTFAVTELGYVFPHDKDLCNWELFSDGYNTTSKSFEKGSVCHTATKTALPAKK